MRSTEGRCQETSWPSDGLPSDQTKVKRVGLTLGVCSELQGEGNPRLLGAPSSVLARSALCVQQGSQLRALGAGLGSGRGGVRGCRDSCH